MDLLQGLNPAQREAVEAETGPLLILAGPGSGKTRVIAHRIAHLVSERRVPPWRIIAVTFTNKAAREMRQRVVSLLGSETESLTAGTFHAICSRILRIDGAAIGVDRGFSIYDDRDQIDLVKKVFAELGLDPNRSSPRAALSAISNAKSELLTPEQYARQADDYFQEVVGRIYRVYQRRLQQSHALDFDDLIMRTVELFRVSSETLEKYSRRYLHVLVDEFQDTNAAQYVLTRQLASAHGNICVVGDPDQSIYAWRSADVRIILNFERDFPGTRVIPLEQNYRSTQTILDGAQGVIRANNLRPQRDLWTENGVGEPITLLEGRDETHEAKLIIDEIERELKKGRRRPGDFAIMYRTNGQSKPLEEELVRRKLPYRLVGGTRFYERKEVKDALAYLRLIQNPFDSISLLRVINVPGRGIGNRTIDELARWSADLGLPIYSALQLLDVRERGEGAPTVRPPFASRATAALLRFLRLLEDLIDRANREPLGELFEHLVQEVDFKSYLEAQERADERLDNLQRLVDGATVFQNEFEAKALADGLDLPDGADAAGRELRGSLPAAPESGEPGPLAGYLAGVALTADVDELKTDADAITLITLHAAKGLEFPVAFIAGLEEGVLPHFRSQESEEQLEEERRLCYVGITRARERLYLSYAGFRMTQGRPINSEPSPFLDAIPRRLLRQPNEKRTSERIASWQPRLARVPALASPDQKPIGPEPVEAPVFQSGDRVLHKKFGTGIVVGCRPTQNDQEVTVAFAGEQGLKRLLLSFAGLQKL